MTTEELKNAINNKNVIIGTKETLKYLKMKSIKLVVLADNCPDNIKKDIEHYAKMGDVKIEVFEGSGKQLGTFCGKPFAINTIAIKVK